MKKKNKQLLKRITAALSVAVFALFLFVPSASAAVTNQSIAVPMYEYPTIGTFWDDITAEGGPTLPFVIVNPGNGPGVSVDPTYTAEIAENTTEGIRSIGYVYSSYQTRNWQDVYDDINTWYQMYPGISGIFIDLVADDTAEELCYMAGLYNHVKNTQPNDLVVLNPGTNISMDYEPYGDIFMNGENTFAAYQSGWNIMYPGWEDNPAYQNRFWHSIHTVDPSDYTAALALTRANNAGWVYLTDDVMPNPYKETPTYWSTEVSDVGALPASNIPNRGKTQLPAGCRDLTASATNTNQATAGKMTTTSAITVANTSADYAAEPTTTINFAMPAGVTLSGTGTDWTCDASGLCSYDADIPASGNAAVLSAAFTADCTYDSGNVTGTLSNFAGNTFTLAAITPTKPTDCPTSAAGQLADAGIATGVSATVAIAITVVAARVYFSRTRVRYQHQEVRWRNR